MCDYKITASGRWNEEERLYKLYIDGDVFVSLDTCGVPLVLDDEFTFSDEVIADGLISGVDFVDEDDFDSAIKDFCENGSFVTDEIELYQISSYGVKDYFKAVILTLHPEAEIDDEDD